MVSGRSRYCEWSTSLTPDREPSGFVRLHRNWKSGDTVRISFVVQPRVTHWFHNASVFERGPLVFSLPLDGEWTALKTHAEKSADWEITPRRPWNFAVELGNCAVRVKETELGSNVPFDYKSPGVELLVEAKQVPSWHESENSAGPVPASPVASTEPVRTLRLAPYGSAKLRITEFPYLDQRASCQGSRTEAAAGGD